MAGTGITLLHIFRGGLAGVWHRLLCILPFKGAAGGPDRAGSAAVQAQTAQKHSPAGCWAAVWLWLLTLVRRAGVLWGRLGVVWLCGFRALAVSRGFLLIFGDLGKFFHALNCHALPFFAQFTESVNNFPFRFSQCYFREIVKIIIGYIIFLRFGIAWACCKFFINLTEK